MGGGPCRAPMGTPGDRARRSGPMPGATSRPCWRRRPRCSSPPGWKHRSATSRRRPEWHGHDRPPLPDPGRSDHRRLPAPGRQPRRKPGRRCWPAATPHEALRRWVDLFVDFLSTKHGLAATLQSGVPRFAPLHAYFLERLTPVCASLLDAAASAGQIGHEVNAGGFLFAIGNLCAGGSERPPLRRAGHGPPARRPAPGPVVAPEINSSKPRPARDLRLLHRRGQPLRRGPRDGGAGACGARRSAQVAARENRAFLGRAVRYLTAEAGITQFLDIGSGLPATNNVHQVAQAIAPSARVVYADNDPLVHAHAKALLASAPAGRTAYLHGDLRDPAAILSHPATRAVLDFGQPVALMLVAVLHFIPDESPARPDHRDPARRPAPGQLPGRLASDHPARPGGHVGRPADHAGGGDDAAEAGLRRLHRAGLLRAWSWWRPAWCWRLSGARPGTARAPAPAEVNCYAGVARKP